MIRLWLAFIILAALIHFGIQAWQTMTGKDRWVLTKSLGYSIIVSLLTLMIMVAIVVIF